MKEKQQSQQQLSQNRILFSPLYFLIFANITISIKICIFMIPMDLMYIFYIKITSK